MKMPFSAATFWRYILLVSTSLISCVDVLLIESGVGALGITGSVLGAYTAASMGFLIMMIAFVGAMASVRRAIKMSWVFIALTLACVILQTVCMVAFSIMKNSFTQRAAQRIDDIWENRATSPAEMDNIQLQYHCCGKESPQDHLLDDDDTVPISCCYMEDCSGGNIFSRGCVLTTAQFFDSKSDQLILLNIGTNALQILSVISAYFMARKLRANAQKREQLFINE